MPVSATHWYIMGVNGWYIMGVNAWYIMGVNPWYIIACKLTVCKAVEGAAGRHFVAISREQGCDGVRGLRNRARTPLPGAQFTKI